MAVTFRLTALTKICRVAVLGRQLFWLGCIALLTGVETGRAQDAEPTQDGRFLSVAWVQNAAEYQILTRQCYRLAHYQMSLALNDPWWSADEFQVEQGDFRDKPPAVVLDLDETVLDNSVYNARNIVKQQPYSLKTWNQWCWEEKATLIPGAAEFLRAAEALGVKVIFITNRTDEVKQATINNLKRCGIAVDETWLLTRNDSDGRAGDKISRRAQVAAEFRILLLIGDNLSDICSEVEINDNELRNQTAHRKTDYLGTRWIVLPNPMYGSWERALPKNPAAALRLDWGTPVPPPTTDSGSDQSPQQPEQTQGGGR